MRKLILAFVFGTACVLNCGVLGAQNAGWDGEWVTNNGVITFRQQADTVRGTFANGGNADGKVNGAGIEGSFRSGDDSGSFELTLADDGLSFTGERQLGRQRTDSWRGWKRDPDAANGDDADFSGYWLSNWGTMQIEQQGNQVTGTFMAAGWGALEGTVTGRTLTFEYKRYHFDGTATIELSADGTRILGATTHDDEPVQWFGVKPAEFEHHVAGNAGEIVQGVADNGMLYYLRMPDDWTEGKQVDVVVLLHGSNWTTAGMVYITNENWPDVGRKFAILGIQGESWADWSDLEDLRFNYTYVNWVGRSKYEGFPYTDRESPYLVAKVIDELDELYGFGRVFVGGHSQGGYLAYMMHMHFPEKLAGTFPMAGGMIFQAEPEAFDDEDLIEAQKETPMVIIHGKRDNVVDYGMSEHAFGAFTGYGFDKVRLISPNLGHPYDFLPVGEAINWLDAMSTDNASELAAFARAQVEERNWRDVGHSIVRAKQIGAGAEFAPIWESYENAASVDAAKFLREIERNRNSRWIDDFLRYREKFSNADAAAEVMSAFEELRAEHDLIAEELKTQANQAFSNGNRRQGLALMQEIVDDYYASSHYPAAKAMLKE